MVYSYIGFLSVVASLISFIYLFVSARKINLFFAVLLFAYLLDSEREAELLKWKVTREQGWLTYGGFVLVEVKSVSHGVLWSGY